MLANIIIHRGTHTIGGTCIEIRSKDCRIIFDLGMPLMENGGGELDEEKLEHPSTENGILPNVNGLYKHQHPTVDAVFISHAHIDHYGLLNYLHPSIPVYLSRGSLALIKTGKIFYPEKNRIIFENYRVFEHWKPFGVGPFRITSYLMDHSGYDASALLIESENKKIFYTGDFRGHGRKSKVLERLVRNPIKDVDCLLMEGTTLGGNHNVGFETEFDVEGGLFKVFSGQRDVSFIMAAGSNIDRIVSIYKAVIDSKKTLVLDLYTYYMLDQLKKVTPASRLPPHPGDNIRVYYIANHAQSMVDAIGRNSLYKYTDRKIEVEEIVSNREQMVLKLPISAMTRISEALIKDHPLDEAKFVFSMWSGYLDKNVAFYGFCKKYHIELLKIHTSGHAYLNDLKRLAAALNSKNLIPIHTLSGDDFNKHFENVVRIEDGAPFDL